MIGRGARFGVVTLAQVAFDQIFLAEPLGADNNFFDQSFLLRRDRQCPAYFFQDFDLCLLEQIAIGRKSTRQQPMHDTDL